MRYRVTLIEGDGIGPEVTGATCRILEAARAPIDWDPAPAGGVAMEKFGVPMPEVTLESIKKNRLGLKGPLMTPKGGGFRSANVAMRQELDLFVGLRPVRTLPNVPGAWPGLDLVLFRENTEDLYAGIEHEVTPGTVVSMKTSTAAAGARIARWAFEYMRYRGRRRIHCCHKAAINPRADGAFLHAFRAVGAEYPFIEQLDMGVDSLSLLLPIDPSKFDVLLLQNLYGDILSDLCAGLAGGLGVVPGANIGVKAAVFEAVHGTAPDIAGQGKANPLALLLSANMLLEHVGEWKIASRIERAVWTVLADGSRITGDLGGNASTEEFTSAVIRALDSNAGEA
ncbi:MAG: isocitrate/isopropylmalate dehydrogenase family protein [Deltaproteobacteria bacterium]|nr:isocitrate/isopropylmalate dehydrogenase family protein [Deltaproteobacteria bacterium]